MANRWGKVERVTGFIFFGSKITADGDCSHEIKRHLVLERKAMTNLDSILKSRDITLPTKVCIVKAIVFPVVMYSGGTTYHIGYTLLKWHSSFGVIVGFWIVVVHWLYNIFMKGRGTQLPVDLEIYWDVFSGNHDRLYFLWLQNHCRWWLQPQN